MRQYRHCAAHCCANDTLLRAPELQDGVPAWRILGAQCIQLGLEGSAVSAWRNSYGTGNSGARIIHWRHPLHYRARQARYQRHLAARIRPGDASNTLSDLS